MTSATLRKMIHAILLKCSLSRRRYRRKQKKLHLWKSTVRRFDNTSAAHPVEKTPFDIQIGWIPTPSNHGKFRGLLDIHGQIVSTLKFSDLAFYTGLTENHTLHTCSVSRMQSKSMKWQARHPKFDSDWSGSGIEIFKIVSSVTAY